MALADVTKMALRLSPKERLELAQHLIESVIGPDSFTTALAGGIRRIEDVAAGRVKGLTEEEYRKIL